MRSSVCVVSRPAIIVVVYHNCVRGITYYNIWLHWKWTEHSNFETLTFHIVVACGALRVVWDQGEDCQTQHHRAAWWLWLSHCQNGPSMPCAVHWCGRQYWGCPILLRMPVRWWAQQFWETSPGQDLWFYKLLWCKTVWILSGSEHQIVSRRHCIPATRCTWWFEICSNVHCAFARACKSQ